MEKVAVEIEPIRRALRSGGEPPKRRAAGAIKALALLLEEWLPAFDGKSSSAPTLVDGHRVAKLSMEHGEAHAEKVGYAGEVDGTFGRIRFD